MNQKEKGYVMKRIDEEGARARNRLYEQAHEGLLLESPSVRDALKAGLVTFKSNAAILEAITDMPTSFNSYGNLSTHKVLSGLPELEKRIQRDKDKLNASKAETFARVAKLVTELKDRVMFGKGTDFLFEVTGMLNELKALKL